jgi:DNA-binding NarL/FixJ family response regulator
MNSEEVILIVEDEADIRHLIEVYLIEYGYQVVLAESGERALELFPQVKPDLVILDVLLGGIDGMEVCRRLREHSYVPILFLTCLDEAEDVACGLDSGGDDYITKPFHPTLLLARVRANLRRIHYQERLGAGPAAQSQTKQDQPEAKEAALTPREQEILDLIAGGLSNQEIAERLHISVGTVKGYNHQIFSKLEVKSRTQAILRAKNLT